MKLTCSCAIWYFGYTYLQDDKLTDTVATDLFFFASKKTAQANFCIAKNRNRHLKNLMWFLSFH